MTHESQGVKNILNRRPLLAFFVLAYAISWALWLPAILAHLQNRQTAAEGALWLTLGNYGPALAALTLAVTLDGAAGLRTLFQRFQPRRTGLFWYLVALYGFMALGLLGVASFGVARPGEVLSKVPGAVVNTPVNALTLFLFLGPLGEEPGWRGYALPRLQTERGALSASLMLGVLWALWHAPLMVFPEWRSALPLGTFVVLYVLYISPLSIIFTWVYNQAHGSVLVTLVLHAAFNYTIFALNQTFDLAQYDPLVLHGAIDVLLWLAAAVLVGAFGSAHLSKRLLTRR